MRVRTLHPPVSPHDRPEGFVARDVPSPVRGQGVLFRKGTLVTPADASRFAELSPDGPPVRLLVPGSDEIPEDEAALQLGRLVANEYLRVDPPQHGQVALRAATRGLLRLNLPALDALNEIRGILVLTPATDRPVEQGALVGTAKAAPILLPRRSLARAARQVERLGAPLAVLPFQPCSVALLSSERLSVPALERARANLGGKLAAYGSSVTLTRTGLTSQEEVAQALLTAAPETTGLFLLAGGVATDPLDPFFGGLRDAGGQLTRLGLPIDPGTACWVGTLAGRPVLGLASCELFGRVTALDVLLGYVHAGVLLTRPLLASLGRGGLLDGGPSRFPFVPPPSPAS